MVVKTLNRLGYVQKKAQNGRMLERHLVEGGNGPDARTDIEK